MKIKITRKSLALFALTSTTILSGCTAQKKNDEKKNVKVEQEQEEKKFCEHQHLVIPFGNQQFIFRECENDIKITFYYNKVNSAIDYYIKNSDKENILEGRTNDYHIFDIDNQLEEENTRGIEKELIEKGAKVYQLKKK